MAKTNTLKTIITISLVMLALLMGVAVLSGCTASRGAVARGWAGGVVKGDVLYVGSMTGNLVSVNLTDGSMIDSIPLEEAQASSGILSCAQASVSVAMYGSPVVEGDIAYLAGYNTGKVYAISLSTLLSTEEVLKKDEESSPSFLIGGIAIDTVTDSVFVGSSDGYVYALKTVSLKPAWQSPFETGAKIWSTPIVSDGTVYIGSFDKKLYALDAKTGDLRWEYETGAAIVSPPAADATTIYVGSFDRYIYALDKNTGELKWKFMADNWFWAKPVVNGTMLYAPCLDGKVYVLNTVTGEKEAEYNLENPISASPVIVDGMLLVATQDDKKGDVREAKLHAIDLTDGTRDTLVSFDEDEGVFADLIAGNGKVYVHSDVDKVYEVDVKTGAKRSIVIEVETEDNED